MKIAKRNSDICLRSSLFGLASALFTACSAAEPVAVVQHKPPAAEKPGQVLRDIRIPTFQIGADQAVFEDAGPQVVAIWATQIKPGARHGPGQAVTFSASASPAWLFSDGPEVYKSGGLRYTPAPDAFGEAIVEVIAYEDGSIQSLPQSFLIRILPVNEAPSFSPGANQFVTTEAGVQSLPGWASEICAGPGGESAQALTFSVTTNRPEFFEQMPALDAFGTLTFAPSGQTGTADVFVTLYDDGGTRLDGANRSSSFAHSAPNLTGMTVYLTETPLTGMSFRYGEGNSSGTPRLFTISARERSPQEVLGVGPSHACVALAEGGVRCWGGNTFGEVGDGTACVGGSTAQGCNGTGGKTLPADVSGLPGLVQAVTVGGNHSCALTGAGGVMCWGANEHGQLGDGTRCDGGNSSGCDAGFGKSLPVDVAGLEAGVQGIAAGGSHTCALTTAGGVKCWGANNHGQLGNGTLTERPAAADVPGLVSGVSSVAAGADHTCALLNTGSVLCWGGNAAGQLGDGTQCDATDFNGCTLGTWGKNAPVAVNGISSVVIGLAAGGVHSCAVLFGGGVVCWGENRYGELGDGSVCDSTAAPGCNGAFGKNIPVAVTGVTKPALGISARANSTCAVTSDGSAWCWGRNIYGQLGGGFLCDGSLANGCNGNDGVSSPVRVAGLNASLQAVVAGGEYACALTYGGAVHCWGDGVYGQLGDGTLAMRLVPGGVSGLLAGIESLTAGARHACVRLSDGQVECWGGNQWGQLGDGTLCDFVTTFGCVYALNGKPRPVRAAGLAGGAVVVEAGGGHTCAISASGAISCWGRNDFGQLGDGTEIGRSAPVSAAAITDAVRAVALGENHTCALTAVGGVKCWGDNRYGQLGDGTICDGAVANGCSAARGKSAPVDVTGMTSGVRAIAAGASFTCGMTDAGTVRCWGDNHRAQLGDGTRCEGTTAFGCDVLWGKSAPVDVTGLTGAVFKLSAGREHICALYLEGGATCWGANAYGQLGDGTVCYEIEGAGCIPGAFAKSVPVAVTLPVEGMLELMGGDAFSCAQTAQRQLVCWGGNDLGQYGNGTTFSSSVPVAVYDHQRYVKLAAGAEFICALSRARAAVAAPNPVTCWGYNSAGQLGSAAQGLQMLPMPVSGF